MLIFYSPLKSRMSACMGPGVDSCSTKNHFHLVCRNATLIDMQCVD